MDLLISVTLYNEFGTGLGTELFNNIKEAREHIKLDLIPIIEIGDKLVIDKIE